MEEDIFAQLDKEIAAITAKSRLKLDAVKLRKAANNMRLSPAERRAAADEFRSIQAIVEADEWRAEFVGALFTEQSCDGCGSVHRNFLQYMLKEVNIRRNSTVRWTRLHLPIEDLPKQTIIQPLSTHICSDCAPDHGFNPDIPEIRLVPSAGGLTVSNTYQQGDINGSD